MRDRIKETIQDCNLNFLIGSGLSRPYLPTLGNIEAQLTSVARSGLDPALNDLLRASLYRKYFDAVMKKNTGVLTGDANAAKVLAEYKAFLSAVNTTLLRRKSTILGKEANLFTTNIDIFLEKALEDLRLEYNDGFNGRFSPEFDLSNFKKSRFKKSLHFDNTSEIPVFNLLKLHGSLCWRLKGERISFCSDLGHIDDIVASVKPSSNFVEIADAATLNDMQAAASGKVLDSEVAAFMKLYDNLLIVNPTKEKFKHTLLNYTYYELLRLYANELEKENTVLFTMGFSFADEHLREITVRAANSNPTLLIYIICFQTKSKTEFDSIFPRTDIKNNNIRFLTPPQKDAAAGGGDKIEYSFENINREIFSSLFSDEDEPGPVAA